jgi:hypothetical protein
VNAVEQAIVDAMTKLRWIVVKERPGVIRGTLNLRRHVAIITVTYTSEWYHIAYAGSENLHYERWPDGSAKIHLNYNGWIKNLMRQIDARLPALPRREPGG